MKTDIDHVLEKIQYTPGDFRAKQDVISGVIVNKEKKILMMDHVKFSFWTIPIGKVEPGQTIEQGLIQEMKEELNITPTKYKKIHQFKKSYVREGKRVYLTAHMYLIIAWRGTVKNNEPKKHRSIKWMSVKEIKKQRISDNTKEMLKVLAKEVNK